MAQTGFNYDAPWLEQSSAPDTPSAGRQKIYPRSDGYWYTMDDAGVETLISAPAGGAAPSTPTFITQTPSGGLSAEQALSALATGLMQVTTATGVVTSVTTSAGLAALISDETGSGALVFATSPTLVTPVLGVAAATSLTTSGTVAFGGGALVANNIIDVNKNFGDFSGTVNAASLISTATISANSAGVLESLFNRAEINQNGFNLTDTLGVRAITNQARVVGASGTVTGLVAMLNTVTNTGAGTLTRAFGFRVAAPGNTGGGVFTNWIAINIDAPVTPTNKTFILLNTTTNPSGDWVIYSTSLFDSAMLGKVSLGKNSAPGATLDVLTSDSGTNAVVNVGIFGHNGGTAAAGFGTGVLLQGESSTTDAQSMARWRSAWSTATHASRATITVLSSFDSTGERDPIGYGANGSATLVGFHTIAAAPVIQYATTGTVTGFTAGAGTPVLSDSTFTGNTGATAYTIADVIRALKLNGLMAA